MTMTKAERLQMIDDLQAKNLILRASIAERHARQERGEELFYDPPPQQPERPIIRKRFESPPVAPPTHSTSLDDLDERIVELICLSNEEGAQVVDEKIAAAIAPLLELIGSQHADICVLQSIIRTANQRLRT